MDQWTYLFTFSFFRQFKISESKKNLHAPKINRQRKQDLYGRKNSYFFIWLLDLHTHSHTARTQKQRLSEEKIPLMKMIPEKNSLRRKYPSF